MTKRACRRWSPSRSRLRRCALPSAFLVAGLSAIAIFVLGVTGPSGPGDPKVTRPILGDASAQVVIREYADFQ